MGWNNLELLFHKLYKHVGAGNTFNDIKSDFAVPQGEIYVKIQENKNTLLLMSRIFASPYQ